MNKIPKINDVIEAFRNQLTKDIDDMEMVEINTEFALLRMLEGLQSDNMFVVDEVDWFRFEARVLAPSIRGELVKNGSLEACLWNLLKISDKFWDVLNDMVEYSYDRYQSWTEAFELASNNGAVSFH